MNSMNFTDVLFSFQGRIGRKTFWLATLVIFLAGLVISAIMAFADEMGAILYLATFWPYLAIGVKRCHDRDQSGWWMLLLFVPVVGFFWWFIALGCLSGTQGANRFGEDPLAGDSGSRSPATA